MHVYICVCYRQVCIERSPRPKPAATCARPAPTHPTHAPLTPQQRPPPKQSSHARPARSHSPHAAALPGRDDVTAAAAAVGCGGLEEGGAGGVQAAKGGLSHGLRQRLSLAAAGGLRLGLCGWRPRVEREETMRGVRVARKRWLGQRRGVCASCKERHVDVDGGRRGPPCKETHCDT